MAEHYHTDVNEETFADVVEGTLEGWLPGYEHIGPEEDIHKCHQFRIVYIGSNVYEVRDHNSGQDIVAKFRVVINVERIG